MLPICWLHISDIHVRERDSWSQDVVLTAMCEHITRQCDKGITPDFILATGDLAFSGKVDEYALVADFFDALSKASGVSKERIFCIPGNHDIDRDRLKTCFSGTRMFLKDQNRIDGLLEAGEDMDTLLKRQENYRDFLNSYFSEQDRTWTDDGLAYVSRLTIQDVRLAIVGMDSAWFAEGGLGDHGKLLIGERQVINVLNLAQEDHDQPHIIVGMAHHPFHLLQEFDRLRVQNRIERTCQFFHCGHLHEPETRTYGLRGTGCLKLAAGASFETREHHNTYSIIMLDLLHALRTVKTIRYNPNNGVFSSASSEEYPIEVIITDICSLDELANAMKNYREALSPWAHYLSALLLDQKAELPIPTQNNQTFGSFAVLETQPDCELKLKTVAFMAFRNALRFLYKRIPLAEIFERYGEAIEQYGAALAELCSAYPAFKDRLAAQENDAQILADARLGEPFFYTGDLLTELATEGDWDLLRKRAQRHVDSPNLSGSIQAKRMLALSYANSHEAADKKTAIDLYQSLAEEESAEISDFGNLANLLIEAGNIDEAKDAVLGGIEKFPANQADYFAQIGHKIVEATGDRNFRKQLEAIIAERGKRD